MLTARLADHAAEVIAIEESPYAVRLGELNMQLNGCGNVRYRRGRVEDAAPGLEGNVDVLVLDPPRAGSAEAAIEAMANLRPQRIVCISCDPSTLARAAHRFSTPRPHTLPALPFVYM